MKLKSTYEILVVGLGSAGSMIVDEVIKRRKSDTIRYVIASVNIDDLRRSSVKDKIRLNDENNLRPILSKIKKSTAVIIIGDVTSANLWIALLKHKTMKQVKSVYSFLIPSLKQKKIESDKYHSTIVELSTRTLYIPVDLFKIYSKYAGNVTFRELEDLARHFTKIAVNSFLYLYDQFAVQNPEENRDVIKNQMREKGRMYFSVGSDSADSVREAYHSPLITEENIRSSRLKLLHVQFKNPISLLTVRMLQKWVEKYKVDIRINAILMERNPKIEDVALTRLWLFE